VKPLASKEYAQKRMVCLQNQQAKTLLEEYIGDNNSESAVVTDSAL